MQESVCFYYIKWYAYTDVFLRYGSRFIMSTKEFKQIQENWSTIISNTKKGYDISDISFKTWFIPMKPLSFENDSLSILYPDEGATEIVQKKYGKMFQVVIEETLGIPCEVIFTSVDSEKSRQEDEELSIRNNLNPRFTFDTFVVGANNTFAYSAALNVSEKPGHMYNPFFIYGGPGLGKTHLMNAIAHKILKESPDKKVIYVTSEVFTNELIESIRGSGQANVEFRKKYRNVDVLLIDDIQFIIGKESTQEEFFHTFNTLYGSNKQIVISSDKPPKDLETLEERLRSRFQSGLTADIQAPNYETRMAILRSYEEMEQKFFNPEILEYIAGNIRSNIRQLEGAFNKLMAYAALTYQGETKEMKLTDARVILKDMISPDDMADITPEMILEIVAEHYHVDSAQIVGKRRVKSITLPRHVCMYLCEKLINMPLKEIGAFLGNRDHTTIINGRNRIVEEIQASKKFESEIEVLIKKIKPV